MKIASVTSAAGTRTHPFIGSRLRLRKREDIFMHSLCGMAHNHPDLQTGVRRKRNRPVPSAPAQGPWNQIHTRADVARSWQDIQGELWPVRKWVMDFCSHPNPSCFPYLSWFILVRR